MIIEEYLVKIHQEELLREAEKDRLVNSLAAGRDRSASVYARLLVWFGGKLRTWGSSLENRFAAQVNFNPQQPADTCLEV